MDIDRLNISDLILIKPKVFADERGYFFESYNQSVFEEKTGNQVIFLQDNESRSNAGVLRGLHFQNPPFAQGKLVRVVRGAVKDVAVDLRKQSPTFGKYGSAILSAENKQQLYVPPGFAHGFLVLEDDTIFSYKCTGFYHQASEGSLAWNDPDINIDWGITDPVLSDKDRNNTVFWRNFQSQF